MRFKAAGKEGSLLTKSANSRAYVELGGAARAHRANLKSYSLPKHSISISSHAYVIVWSVATRSPKPLTQMNAVLRKSSTEIRCSLFTSLRGILHTAVVSEASVNVSEETSAELAFSRRCVAYLTLSFAIASSMCVDRVDHRQASKSIYC